MKYKHIIWDFDGTLFNTYPAMAAAFSQALSERAIIESENTICSYMKVSAGHAAEHYKKLYSLEADFFERYKILQEYGEIKNAKPFDGVPELCRDICKNGGTNYLFTHRGESAEYFIDKFGLRENFTELITSKQGFPRKPSPEALLYLMDKYGFSQENALMIGDRDLDILSAKNAGIHTCYFMQDKDLHHIADVTIHDFSELYSMLGMSLN